MILMNVRDGPAVVPLLLCMYMGAYGTLASHIPEVNFACLFHGELRVIHPAAAAAARVWFAYVLPWLASP